jgi:site-specific recombinase XerD
VPYPYDGTPNLRPGAEREAVSAAPLYDPGLLLSELFEDFIAASASIVIAKTEDGYRNAWGYFTAWLSESAVAPVLGSLHQRTCVAYIARQQRRPKQRGSGTLSSHSVHAYVRPLRTFARWLVAEGYLPRDPFAGGQRGIMPRLGLRALKLAKQEDVDVLLEGSTGGRTPLERAVRGRDELFVLLATDTAFRTSDVTKGGIENFDVADGWAYVERGKGDRARKAPMSRETIASLRTYLRRHRPVLTGTRSEDVRADDPLIISARGGRLTPNGVYQAMSRAYKRGGGSHRFGLHRLRHLFGTAAAEGGMHPVISQSIMGHADEKSQRVYQHPSDATIKAEHAKVTPIRALRPARRRRLA